MPSMSVADASRPRHVALQHTCSRFACNAASVRLEGAIRSAMSSGEEVVGGGSDDSSVVGGGEIPAPRHAKRRRARAEPTRPFLLVACDEHGFWQGAFPASQGSDDQQACILGMVLTQVVASRLDSPTSSALQQRLRDMAIAGARKGVVQGLLEYQVLGVFRLDEPVHLDQKDRPAPERMEDIKHHTGTTVNYDNPTASPKAERANECLNIWAETHAANLMPMALARFACGVARRVMEGEGQHLHCVALTGKVNRKRLLADGDASKKRLKRMREDIPAEVTAPPLVLVEKRWSGSAGTRDPHIMLRWLEISQDLKRQERVGLAFKRFIGLLSDSGVSNAEELSAKVSKAGGTLLVKSRVTLDCSANLLHRQWWASVCKEAGVSVHIFCDASPQWRGIELFATSVDFIVGGQLCRRLAPLVSLNKAQMGHHGKLAALLWQLYLMTGPTFASMQELCAAVRSVTTDLGTERLLSDSGSCLPEFFETLGSAKPVIDSPSGWLFSRCLHVPGFRHMVDNLLQKGLSSMKAFPSFLAKLKCVVKFLRNEQYVGEVCRCLTSKGLVGVAEMVEEARLVSFAAWRWGTLASVCKALEGFVATLGQHFDPRPFQDLRDSADFKQVVLALRSPAWHIQFRFVHWYAGRLSELMSWVGGCSCHPPDGTAFDSPSPDSACPRKGRRLTEAHARVESLIQGMLEEANEWEALFFGGDIGLWQECQGVVRFTVVHAREKFAFASKIPYLFAKLPEAMCRPSSGVRTSCLCERALTKFQTSVRQCGPLALVEGRSAFVPPPGTRLWK